MVDSIDVPQDLELQDVIAWGLGAVDLLCVAAGGVVAWWLYLGLPEPMPARLAASLPVAVAGVVLGALRIGDTAAREWLVLALGYVLRPRLLVTGAER